MICVLEFDPRRSQKHHSEMDDTVDVGQLSPDQQEALQQYTSVTAQDIKDAVPLLQRSQWNVQVGNQTLFFLACMELTSPPDCNRQVLRRRRTRPRRRSHGGREHPADIPTPREPTGKPPSRRHTAIQRIWQRPYRSRTAHRPAVARHAKGTMAGRAFACTARLGMESCFGAFPHLYIHPVVSACASAAAGCH